MLQKALFTVLLVTITILMFGPIRSFDLVWIDHQRIVNGAAAGRSLVEV